MDFMTVYRSLHQFAAEGHEFGDLAVSFDRSTKG